MQQHHHIGLPIIESITVAIIFERFGDAYQTTRSSIYVGRHIGANDPLAPGRPERVRKRFYPALQKSGATIIKVRGVSSAANGYIRARVAGINCQYEIVHGLDINDFTNGRLRAAPNELHDKREAVSRLLQPDR